MARIRTVKPSFWKHEELSALPPETHMLAAALLGYADDEGYFNANPKLVQAECCPLREDSVSVQDRLISLVEIGYLRLGTAEDGKRYGHIIKFLEHQRVNRPTPSEIKKLHIKWEESSSPHAQITEPSLPEGKGKGREKEKEGKGVRASRFTPPTVERVAAYCQERGNKVDAEAFVSFYASKGWKVGNQPMKDWKAAVVTWEKRPDYGSGKNGNGRVPPPSQPKALEQWAADHNITPKRGETHGDLYARCLAA